MDDAEWTREGSLNAVWQVGADGLPPLSWNAHVGVWLKWPIFSDVGNMGGTAEADSFCPRDFAEMRNVG